MILCRVTSNKVLNPFLNKLFFRERRKKQEEFNEERVID